MKIILTYKNGPNQVLDYNPHTSSLPTRSAESNERYIHAIIPVEIKSEENYLDRLKLSAHHEFIGSEDLFEFI